MQQNEGVADLIVVGAGHAGCEAALAAARMGARVLLYTLNLDAVALMPCNPSIGGTGKGHLVREVDALGGEMGLAIDDTLLQSRMLNTGKGVAVHSLRAQADKRAYHARMLRALFACEHLEIRQGEVSRVETNQGRVCGVRTVTGDAVPCRAVIVATGVYLKSRIIIGEASWQGGPQGLLCATELTQALVDLGFEMRRFKTGTPARVDARSIDFDLTTPQPGDEPVEPFSFMTDRALKNTRMCYLTWTNAHTHDIIRENLHRAPMYTGAIHGTGARYCPSIEDKVTRFADKDRHQIFLEPEGADSPEWYVQGMSSSMPGDVQTRMYRSVRGLERARLTRLAYAIEYDCINPLSLTGTLAARDVPGLFLAGQVCGTSGYEEAAAQGILAGVNAALYLKNEPPFLLSRAEAYIGVLADDLTTVGTDEPYRMMTSRAEHRLFLRQDNADLRLTARAHAIGLADDARMRRAEQKQKDARRARALLDEHNLTAALRRPETAFGDLIPACPGLAAIPYAAAREAEIDIKYAGYLQKEAAHIQKARAMEDRLLPEDAPYMTMDALRIEARQKLAARRPRSLGQASRIPGVSPSDVAVLMIWLARETGCSSASAR